MRSDTHSGPSARALPEATAKPGRMLYVDNIRWLMIIFVVLIHAAVTYSGIGSWYYKEPSNLDPASFLIFGIYLSFTQAYSMGLLFFIAGYFVPGAYDYKGPGRFLTDRAVRLAIPSQIYMLFVNFIIEYYILASNTRPPLIEAFPEYVLSLEFLSGSGPMWFALALLIFTAAYALFRVLIQDRGKSSDKNDGKEKVPGYSAVIALGFVIAVCAFTIRLVQPIGTSIMNMQLCFFSQYIILFAAGVWAYRNRWLSRIPYEFGITWFKVGLIAGSIFWLAMIILGGGASGDLTLYAGGLHWQSAAYAFWESFFCVGISLGIIVIFRERFNKQGRFARFMSKNYFTVYVFHPPILILVSLALSSLELHPLIKFLATSSVALLLCFISSQLVLRKIPLLRRVL